VPLLERITRRQVSYEVREQLRELIASGAFQPAERLPSERDLMEALGVSRTAIREALRSLEGLGVVTIRHGAGVYVAEGAAGPAGPSGHRIPRAGHARTPRDLIEVRLIVEPEASALAAGRATTDDLRRLDRDIEQFRAEVGRRRRPPTDLRFHLDLCRATHNPMLLAIGKWVIEFYARSGQLPQGRDVEDHARVFEAVRRRDPEAARAAMRAHLEWVRESLETAVDLAPTGVTRAGVGGPTARAVVAAKRRP
jgi:DNA-binding FadR family transcriptional regulator